MTARTVKTACPRDCYDTCTLRVTVEDGRVTRVEGDPEHPVTRGFTCPRGSGDPKRVHSDGRVLYPYVRDGSGEHRRVTWDKALDTVVSNLKQTLEEYGPDHVLQLDYAGNMGFLTEPWSWRLWNALGTALHDATICSKSGHAGLALHYGRTYGVEPDELGSKALIVFWGFNAKVSSPHTWALAEKARTEGDTLISVVDPRRSETAESADLWLSPKPGSDVALAYGVARCLIEGGHVNEAFIEEWTHGYDEYRTEALRWTEERVEEATGLRWEEVEALARLYGERLPSVTVIGIGLQKSLYGAEQVRAVSLIPPLLGLHRGFYYSNGQGRHVDQAIVSGSVHAKERRLLGQVGLGRTLESGEINFLYVNNMNPASTLPDQNAFRRGLEREDVFVVVHDTHWTETARYADVVLPAATYLEKDDVVLGYNHTYVTMCNRAIEPLGESRDETWLTARLAERLGLEDEWLREDPWDVLRRAFEGAFADGGFDDLLAGRTLKLKMRPRDEYQTPTGRVEFHSTRAEEQGVNPLPLQHPIAHDKGEYVLLTSGVAEYTHSQFRDVYGPIEPIVWINEGDAEGLGVVDGDAVELSNELGTVSVRAVVTDGVGRGVLWSPRLWEGLNGRPQNTLMSGRAQPLGGGPVFNSTLVRVRKP